MKSFLRRWAKPSRIVPFATALAAALALVGDMLGLIPLSLADEIIVALLALLAVDALSERIDILERIETKLSSMSPSSLMSGTELPSVEEQAKQASEMVIVGVSATGLVTGHSSFFEQKIKEGCVIRALLLMPDSSSLEILNSRTLIHNDPSTIERTIRHLEQFNQIPMSRGRCAIRLSSVFLPFSAFGTDLEKRSGAMSISFFNYRTTVERPYLMLYAADDSKWYEYFLQQVRAAWDDSVTLEEWRTTRGEQIPDQAL